MNHVAKMRTADRSTQPPIAYGLNAYAVAPVMAPKGKKSRSSQSLPERRSRMQAASITKIAAGMMCIMVSVAFAEKVASRAAIGRGLLSEGWISSLSLRNTTARAMITQIQKPDRSHKGWLDVRYAARCSVCAGCVIPLEPLAYDSNAETVQ